jgi:hypothetical protein
MLEAAINVILQLAPGSSNVHHASPQQQTKNRVV